MGSKQEGLVRQSPHLDPSTSLVLPPALLTSSREELDVLTSFPLHISFWVLGSYIFPSFSSKSAALPRYSGVMSVSACAGPSTGRPAGVRNTQKRSQMSQQMSGGADSQRSAPCAPGLCKYSMNNRLIKVQTCDLP